jgi:hypothetical protein
MGPLYGRFIFGTQIPLKQLIGRLEVISKSYLNDAPFHAYVTTQGGETFYGLTHDELLSHYEDHEGEIKTISTAVTTPDIRVMRVHIHFDPQNKGRGQFVIAIGDAFENKVIKAVLLGQKPPERPGKKITGSLDQIGAQPLVPKLTFTPPTNAFRKSFVTMNDHFFFSRKISIYELLALLDELSDKYMDYRSFHAQLETSDGDYYFDIQREEMRYMFNQRRHTLMALFLYISNREGHWIDLMLSFHPLEQGTNGEVEIHAPGTIVDEINSLIWDRLSVEPSNDAMAVRLLKMPFDQKAFSMPSFSAFFKRLVHLYLFQVPPVATVYNHRNQAYTGLSFYQLEKMYKERRDEVSQVTIDVTQVVTGQNCQLILDFGSENPFAQLNLMLGDEDLHQKVQKQVSAFFEPLKGDEEPPAPSASPAAN